MGETMTVAEMDSRFDSEWILVLDPKPTGGEEVVRGKVAFHSKNRDEVYRKAIELKPKTFAIHYTGLMPKGTAIILCALDSTRDWG